MKSLLHALPHFASAFLITALIMASLAAVSVLGSDDKALYYEKESGTFYFFGEEYVLSDSFMTWVKSVFDFNSVYLGKRLKSGVQSIIGFTVKYVIDAFGIVFGVFERIINNCV